MVKAFNLRLNDREFDLLAFSLSGNSHRQVFSALFIQNELNEIVTLKICSDQWSCASVVICLERGANDLHMVQLMPLPPRHLLLQQNPEWFILLVQAYLGCPGQRSLNGCVWNRYSVVHTHFCSAAGQQVQVTILVTAPFEHCAIKLYCISVSGLHSYLISS